MNEASGTTSDFEGVEVIIRLKPLSPDENDPDQRSCVTVSPTENNTVIVETPNKKEYFSFDHVASELSQQQDIFEFIGLPVLEESFKGYNCCIFAYGQTGAGKTYSILGDAAELTDNALAESRGVLPRLMEHLFQKLTTANCKYQVNCSYLEIYNEQIIDLLNKEIRAYPIREDCKRGVYVEGISEEPLISYSDAIQFIFRGLKNRKVASTSMNSESSRSHTIFTVNLKLTSDENDTQIQRHSKIHIVDLAGSERQRQTNVSGERLKEGCNINRSLHCLGNVINSLVESIKKKKYIPFRDSKLTFFLKDSLGGNSKTKLLANINPRKQFLGDTISTLMFAKRAKILKVRVEANQNVVGDLDSLRTQIRKLRQELSQAKFIKTSLEVSKIEDQTKPVEPEKEVVVRERSLDIDFTNQTQLQKVIDVFSDNENNYRMLIHLYEQRIGLAQKPQPKGDFNFKQLFQQKRVLEKQNANYQQLIINFPSFTKLFKDSMALKKKVKLLESDYQKLSKDKEQIWMELEHLRNNNIVLKEERDDLEASMINYKTEVDQVLTSGLKSQEDKKVEYPQILPLLELSRLQDQAALNITKREDMRDLMMKQNNMLEDYESMIEDLRVKFTNCMLELQQSYDQLHTLYQHQKEEKNSLKKMKRPEQSPQIQTLQNQNEYLKLNIMELQNQIGRYEQQSFKNTIQIRTLQQSNQKLSKQLNELKSSSESNGLEEAQLVSLMNKLKQIKLSAQKQHEEVEIQFQRQESEFNNLKQKLMKATQENSILVNKLQVLQHRCKELKKRFGQSSKSTTAEVSDQVSNQEEYLEQSIVFNTKIVQLSKEVAHLTYKNSELEKELEEQSLKNTEDRSKLERTSMKILSVSKQLARLKQQNQHQVEQLMRMQMRLDESEKQVNSFKEKNKLLQIQHNRVKKQLDKRQQISHKIKVQLNKTQIELLQDFKVLQAQMRTLKNQIQRNRIERKKGYSSSSRSLKNYNSKQELHNNTVQPFTLAKGHHPAVSSVQKKERTQSSAQKKDPPKQKSYFDKKDLSSTYTFSNNRPFHDTSADMIKNVASMTPDAGKTVGVFSKNRKVVQKAQKVDKVLLSSNIPPTVPRKK